MRGFKIRADLERQELERQTRVNDEVERARRRKHRRWLRAGRRSSFCSAGYHSWCMNRDYTESQCKCPCHRRNHDSEPLDLHTLRRVMEWAHDAAGPEHNAYYELLDNVERAIQEELKWLDPAHVAVVTRRSTAEASKTGLTKKPAPGAGSPARSRKERATRRNRD